MERTNQSVQDLIEQALLRNEDWIKEEQKQDIWRFKRLLRKDFGDVIPSLERDASFTMVWNDLLGQPMGQFHWSGVTWTMIYEQVPSDVPWCIEVKTSFRYKRHFRNRSARRQLLLWLHEYKTTNNG